MKTIKIVQAISQILAKNVAILCPESSKICLKSPKTSISTNLSKFWQLLAYFQAKKSNIQNFRPKSKKELGQFSLFSCLLAFENAFCWKIADKKLESAFHWVNVLRGELWWSKMGIFKWIFCYIKVLPRSCLLETF